MASLSERELVRQNRKMRRRLRRVAAARASWDELGRGVTANIDEIRAAQLCAKSIDEALGREYRGRDT